MQRGQNKFLESIDDENESAANDKGLNLQNYKLNATTG